MEALLASCDRAPRPGARLHDLTVLARLGLRARVAALRLDGVDWRP